MVEHSTREQEYSGFDTHLPCSAIEQVLLCSGEYPGSDGSIVTSENLVTGI